jgi:hypothetical protein
MSVYSPKRILALIGVSYLVSFFLILSLNELTKKSYQLSTTNNRKILKAVINPVFSEEIPFHPEEIKSDGKYLYVLQLAINQIKVFDARGKSIDSLGRRGDSIGQYQHIISFFPTKKTLTVADGKKQVITFLDDKYKVTDTVKLQKKFSRILLLPNNKAIVESLQSWGVKNHLSEFNLIDLKDPARTIPRSLIPKREYNGLIYDGFFTSNKEAAFFVSYYYNDLVGIDMSGKVLFKKKTIDNVAPPTVKVSSGGWATYSGDVKLVNFGSTADNSFLYVLSNVQQKISASQIGYYTDLYDLKDGNYRGSILLPEVDSNNPGRICSLNDNLYVLYKNKLVCYNVKYL